MPVCKGDDIGSVEFRMFFLPGMIPAAPEEKEGRGRNLHFQAINRVSENFQGRHFDALRGKEYLLPDFITVISSPERENCAKDSCEDLYQKQSDTLVLSN